MECRDKFLKGIPTWTSRGIPKKSWKREEIKGGISEGILEEIPKGLPGLNLLSWKEFLGELPEWIPKGR